MSTMESNCGRILALLMTLLGFLTTHATGQETPSFLENGVTAHRGNSIAYPENTMSAFRNAMAAGVDWIEADVWLTKDRVLVVIHDSTTARVGNKNLSVISSTYSELRTVDVATMHPCSDASAASAASAALTAFSVASSLAASSACATAALLSRADLSLS